MITNSYWYADMIIGNIRQIREGSMSDWYDNEQYTPDSGRLHVGTLIGAFDWIGTGTIRTTRLDSSSQSEQKVAFIASYVASWSWMMTRAHMKWYILRDMSRVANLQRHLRAVLFVRYVYCWRRFTSWCSNKLICLDDHYPWPSAASKSHLPWKAKKERKKH